MKFKPSATGPKPRSAQSHNAVRVRGPLGLGRRSVRGPARSARAQRRSARGGAALRANGGTALAHGRRPGNGWLTGAGTAARRDGDGDGQVVRRPGGGPGDTASDCGSRDTRCRGGGTRGETTGGRCEAVGRRARGARRCCRDAGARSRQRF
jgi:hypothetical protein